MLPLDVEFLYYYVNKLYRAKEDHTFIRKNWYYKFYERNPSVKILKTRLMEKARLINKNSDDYIKWFRAFIKIVNKWGLIPENIYNIDESGAGLGFTQQSYIIGPEEEKDIRILINTNREWITLIKTINIIREVLESFFY